MSQIEVPKATQMQWQQLVNILVQLTGSISALINTGNLKEIEILTSSSNEKKPLSQRPALRCLRQLRRLL